MEVGQGLLQPCYGLHAGVSRNNQLGQEGVVVGRNGVALIAMAVHPDARPLRRLPSCNQPRRWPEIVSGLLGIDATFDGVPAGDQLRLRKADRLALRHLDLFLDQVDAGDHLRNRVLHLYAGVHLQEVEASLVLVEYKLGRTGVFVFDGFGYPQGRLAQPLSELARQPRRRRLLDQFLVTALHRTVPLEQMDIIAAPVGQHLYFDMAGVGDKGFEVQTVVAKGRTGLCCCLSEYGLQVIWPVDRFHALAAASRRRLQQDRVSDLFRHRRCPGEFVDEPGPGHYRNTQFRDCLPGSQLVAHRLDVPWTGADENEAVVQAGLG